MSCGNSTIERGTLRPSSCPASWETSLQVNQQVRSLTCIRSQ